MDYPIAVSLGVWLWYLSLTAFIVLVIVACIRHFNHPQKSATPVTPTDAANAPKKNSKLQKAIIGLAMLVAIPLLIVVIASVNLFTFKYQPSETTARGIEQYIIGQTGHSSAEEVISWKTFFGRVYAADCVFLSEHSLAKTTIVKSALAVTVDSINVPLLRLGCSPFEVAYFNARGNFLANCPGDLACLLIGDYDFDKVDYIYPGKQ